MRIRWNRGRRTPRKNAGPMPPCCGGRDPPACAVFLCVHSHSDKKHDCRRPRFQCLVAVLPAAESCPTRLAGPASILILHRPQADITSCHQDQLPHAQHFATYQKAAPESSEYGKAGNCLREPYERRAGGQMASRLFAHSAFAHKRPCETETQNNPAKRRDAPNGCSWSCPSEKGACLNYFSRPERLRRVRRRF